MMPIFDSPSLLIFGFGGPLEVIVILVVVLLLFGGRIPGMARSLGQGIVEFRKGLKDDGSGKSDDDSKAATSEDK